VRAKVNAALHDWRSSDPATYHTPEGFDALKQMLGGFKETARSTAAPRGKSPTTLTTPFATRLPIRHPVYDKVMGDYSKASQQHFRTGKGTVPRARRVTPNTALRKLQSVMRDNVNTSWGKRAELAGNLTDRWR
jgi:hypothetical protein